MASLSIMGDQLRVALKSFEHHSSTVPRGLRRTLHWPPIIPIVVSVMDARKINFSFGFGNSKWNIWCRIRIVFHIPGFAFTSKRKERMYIVGGSRGLNKANRNIVRQITKFGIIVFYKILINIINIMLIYVDNILST